MLHAPAIRYYHILYCQGTYDMFWHFLQLNNEIQGISWQSNLALMTIWLLIFADILGPMCSWEKHIYAEFISFYFFDEHIGLKISAKNKSYILCKAKLLCHEIPCTLLMSSLLLEKRFTRSTLEHQDLLAYVKKKI